MASFCHRTACHPVQTVETVSGANRNERRGGKTAHADRTASASGGGDGGGREQAGRGEGDGRAEEDERGSEHRGRDFSGLEVGETRRAGVNE